MFTILSYQRSGNHLVRYLIEFLTAHATLGCSKRDPPLYLRKKIKYLDHVIPGQAVGQKTHRARWVQKDTEGLIFILRNPYEAIFSQRKGRYPKYGPGDAGEIVSNIRFFEAYSKPKLLLLYENLVYRDHTLSVTALATFLGVPDGIRDELLGNWAKYWEDSLGGPKRPAGTSCGSETHYLDQMAPEEAKSFKALVAPRLKHPLLMKHYGIPTED